MAATTKTIEQEFIEEFDGSRQRAMHAREVFPSGVTHDSRYARPFPLFIERANGAYKWDVDGHQITDYAVGHGALIAGHNNPAINEPVAEQLRLGTHFGANHDLELVWAEWIQRLVPSAERVKFTASGTESTMLAMRVARAFTGREKILKFAGHFHGWNDYLVKGEKPPFDRELVPGVPREVSGSVVVAPEHDIAVVENEVARGEIAAVIIEPSGASWAAIPFEDGFLAALREVTRRHDVLLIFDEVITGFRWAPGGAQERFGVLPDLTTMAKIVAGGLPGGAVGGTAEVMAVLEFRDDPEWNGTRKVGHPGTYNGNPLAAVAGAKCLEIVADPAVQRHCDELAAHLRAGANTILVQHDLPGFVYGEASVFHVILGSRCTNLAADDLRMPLGVPAETLKEGGAARMRTILTAGMLLEGNHLFGGGGFTTIAHTLADIEQTLAGFERTVLRMRDEGAFSD